MPFGKGGVWQAPRIVTVHFPTNAAILTSPNVAAFIADADYEVVSVAEIHETIGSDGSAVTLDVVKATGTQAASAGTSMLASTFSLKSTLNTVVRKDRGGGGLATARTTCQLAKGDRVAIKFGGTLTAVTGVCVSLVLVPFQRKPKW